MIKFWSTVLHYELRDAAQYHDTNQRYWSLADPTNNEPRIIIQRVPEPVISETRFHSGEYNEFVTAEMKTRTKTRM